MSTTTVQVRTETRRLLEKLKKEMGVKSYDEVIGKLARRGTGIATPVFGTCKGSKSFKREPEIEHRL